MPSKASEAYGARTALACGAGACGCTLCGWICAYVFRSSPNIIAHLVLDNTRPSITTVKSVNKFGQPGSKLNFFRVVFSRAPPPNTKLEFVPKGLLVFVCDRFGLRTLNFVLGAVGR